MQKTMTVEDVKASMETGFSHWVDMGRALKVLLAEIERNEELEAYLLDEIDKRDRRLLRYKAITAHLTDII